MITELELEELPTCRDILYSRLCTEPGCSRLRDHRPADAHYLIDWPDQPEEDAWTQMSSALESAPTSRA